MTPQTLHPGPDVLPPDDPTRRPDARPAPSVHPTSFCHRQCRCPAPMAPHEGQGGRWTLPGSSDSPALLPCALAVESPLPPCFITRRPGRTVLASQAARAVIRPRPPLRVSLPQSPEAAPRVPLPASSGPASTLATPRLFLPTLLSAGGGPAEGRSTGLGAASCPAVPSVTCSRDTLSEPPQFPLLQSTNPPGV